MNPNKTVRITREAYEALLKYGRVNVSYQDKDTSWERTLYAIGYDEEATAINKAAVSFDLTDGMHLVNLEIAEENAGVLLDVSKAKKDLPKPVECYTENGVPQP